MATRPVLPYEKVQTFNYGGKIYPTEEAVIRAAVEDILGNAGITALILSKSEELLPLLTRYTALAAATAAGQG
jgi:hypothetical protein